MAYLTTQNGETSEIAALATADGGFNCSVDLLIATDMYGRVEFAVVEHQLSNDFYEQLEIIQSQWMTNFTRQSMRDILRLSGSKIDSLGENKQAISASLTRKSVSNEFHDSLSFIQSSRVALKGGG